MRCGLYSSCGPGRCACRPFGNDDSMPKKRKVKGTPKRKKKSLTNRSIMQKYYGKPKVGASPRKLYPKVRKYNRDFD